METKLVDHSPDRALKAGANQRWGQLFHDRSEVVAVYIMEEVFSVGQSRGNVAVAVFKGLASHSEPGRRYRQAVLDAAVTAVRPAASGGLPGR